MVFSNKILSTQGLFTIAGSAANLILGLRLIQTHKDRCLTTVLLKQYNSSIIQTMVHQEALYTILTIHGPTQVA